MNQKKSKTIRKMVYGDNKPNPKYTRLESKTGRLNPLINIGDMEKVMDSSTGQARELPKRRIYKYMKKVSKNLPIKTLRKLYKNEK